MASKAPAGSGSSFRSISMVWSRKPSSNAVAPPVKYTFPGPLDAAGAASRMNFFQRGDSNFSPHCVICRLCACAWSSAFASPMVLMLMMLITFSLLVKRSGTRPGAVGAWVGMRWGLTPERGWIHPAFVLYYSCILPVVLGPFGAYAGVSLVGLWRLQRDAPARGANQTVAGQALGVCGADLASP